MRNNVSRFFALFTIAWLLLVFATACTTAWTSEASSIISLLVPALSSLAAILSAFGVGLSPQVVTSVNSWAAQSQAALATVKDLIAQYDAATADAKPGILSSIKAALDAVVGNLQIILPELHVANAQTQAKITAILQLVEGEMVALINLVPALNGQVTSHHELKSLMAALKSPQEFKQEFNSQIAEFGDQYKI